MSGGRRSFITQTLGPGLLFAGAAVGVSHLVQSTRAGATYGLALLGVVIVANILKYPAFSFGPHYAAATGTSLLEGYRRQGRGALGLYAVVTFGTMFTVQAAVTVVTAAIAGALFHMDRSPVQVSAALLVICIALLAVGRYHWLDRIVKVVVASLTVLTLIATVLVLPRIDWSASSWVLPGDQWNLRTAIFVAPLIGWMPSAIDISVWHSLWTLAKRRDTNHAPSLGESLLDFKIGYLGTVVLAICFLLLGAGTMHGHITDIPASPGRFANLVIAMYTQTLGEWSRYLIGGCALMVMFSTTLTVVDGFPRALSGLVDRFRGAEQPGADEGATSRPVYWIAAAMLAAGSLWVIHMFMQRRFTALIDVATALSFVTAPVLAALNHRAVISDAVAPGDRPSLAMRRYSAVSIGVLSLLVMGWLYIRFVA